MSSSLLSQYKFSFQKEHICHSTLMESQELVLHTMGKFFGIDAKAKIHILKQMKSKDFQKMSIKSSKEKPVQV